MKILYPVTKKRLFFNIVIIVLLLIPLLFSCGTDDKKGWLTYRHDGFRSGVTDNKLSENAWRRITAHAL